MSIIRFFPISLCKFYNNYYYSNTNSAPSAHGTTNFVTESTCIKILIDNFFYILLNALTLYLIFMQRIFVKEWYFCCP